MSKDEKKLKKKTVVARVSMPLINPNAAGIDIGDTLHCVAVPAGRDQLTVREFGAFTSDLELIVAWLKQCRVDTVAMESTGIYWKNLFAMLVHHGFEVYLVNAKHTRNITGKKDDESDAQWIQKLHSCGLLKSCFLPDEHTDMLRTLVRHRRSLTQDSSRYVLRMQKALESMNIKIHTVINDITGKTGTAIIKAIIGGERNPNHFLSFIDPRIKADKKSIVKSLEGNWRKEHLFLLQQCYNLYQHMQTQIELCEKQIEQVLQLLMVDYQDNSEHSLSSPPKRKSKNQPRFNTRQYLKNIHKVDVIDIYGLSEISALEIFSETGTDLSKWANEKKFVSWLNLCPNNKISGGKLISSQLMKKRPNAAAQAFRMAANSLKQSKHWLGDYFRRMRSKGGQKYAIVATARKLAIIYYKMVRFKEPFTPFDLNEYHRKYKQAKIAYLEKVLQRLKQAA
jgi:transposase